MSELPNNWIETEIGNLCSLKNGRAFKPSEWQSSGLPIVRIQNLNNPTSTYNYFQGEVDERNRLRGGELLFAWSGTPGTSFGAHVWRDGDAVLNQHIFRVDFDETLLDKRFFRSAINQKLGELIDVAYGGGRCCTNRIADGMTPTPDGPMPQQSPTRCEDGRSD
ncbi:hypothetical protein AVHY2522_21705 [Acidovorax sp. SUPP2522]|uniref:restriction endonuclease subunit S n=1 Tax=unclassified Acidovorax TaxID=2684926 RepID=UPI00234BCA8A|nr:MULTISPECIES: restriction endonuclease subunit S [unclassified Acidovorax]WCM98110.1 restriction endonuclease subunit S [Acidovorax sp. GBBC 1281]GKT19227.1 hypothetical protein AVHY2522_21705 [Acidovorax sp. SUPP2522]